jgi:hypothetical protein
MNGRRFRFGQYAVLLVGFVVPLFSQQPADWNDPTLHMTRFVTANENVRLEVLDWGASATGMVTTCSWS